MIDLFTLNDFQDYLQKTFPDIKWDKNFYRGEYTFFLHIDTKVNVVIRSSIDFSGFSSKVGENSIRLHLEDSSGNLLAANDQLYVTRVVGWRERLTEKIRRLIELRNLAGDCPICKKPQPILRSHTLSNPNRLFAKCWEDSQFKWLEERHG